MKKIDKCRERYSVVIVGAGPAGTNFARRIAGNGRDVLLIDGSTVRGEKVCAGLLSPDAQDLLAEYDINIPKKILSSPQLFSVRTIDLSLNKICHYRRAYMNIDRAGFDNFLLEMVPSTVDVISALCLSIRRENGGFSLELRMGEEQVSVYCDHVVGADGASSVVRKNLFPHKKIERYVAIQQTFPALGENPYYSCIFDSKTSPSCSWIFFKNEALVFGGAFSPAHCREAFEAQKRKLTERGIVPAEVFSSPIKTQACMVCRPHLAGGIFLGADGAFLIGEAAGFISPSSLEGISYALASSEALASAFAENSHKKQILKAYRKGTAGLSFKVKLKCLKRPFMYNPKLRALVLKSGVASIKIKNEV